MRLSRQPSQTAQWFGRAGFLIFLLVEYVCHFALPGRAGMMDPAYKNVIGCTGGRIVMRPYDCVLGCSFLRAVCVL